MVVVSNPPPPPSSIIIIISSSLIIIIISTFPAFILSQNDTSYEDCSPFKCGNLTFSFPFSSSLTSGHCGLPDYQITCDPSSSVPNLLLSGRLYRVKDFYSSKNDRLITVVDTQLIKDLRSGSCDSLYNLSIINAANDSTTAAAGHLTLPSGSLNFTFFKCPIGLFANNNNKIVSNFSCNDGRQELYLWGSSTESVVQQPPLDPVFLLAPPSRCESVQVPVSSVSSLNLNRSADNVFNALNQGFPLEWPYLDECERCQNRSGRCGYDGSLKKIVCFCKGGSCDSVKKSKLALIIGAAAAGSSSAVLITALLVIFRKRITSFFKKPLFEERRNIGDGLNVKQFIETYRSTLLSNYSYNDAKKMTNGFKEKLGEGGYGNVYKGKFPDGRLVAIKMLEKTSNFSDNFINEVATIGRIHHFNIINLLGFCCDDGTTRALIYEYMPNGSLGDYLSKEKENLSTNLAKLLEIATGVAHAIEYLHNGCELRILHLDIKPQNVLLDMDFNPKVSDFGLAKAHTRNRSVVTMTEPRGTIGYIAPEIFMRNLGNPSHKSDVYSYGMLLLEMVGGKRHFEPTETRGGSSATESYFHDWIYKQLIMQQEKVGSAEEEEEEEECIARKMIMIGLWCIQINPKDRPSMTRVVEMLSASVETIEMPPKPLFLSSPPRLQTENEITSFDSNTSDLPLNLDSSEIYYST